MSFKNKKTKKSFPTTSLTEDSKRKILEKAENGMLSCKDAFHLSDTLNISKAGIGAFADSENIRLINCQLGLFGTGPGKKKKITKLDTISDILIEKIQAALVDGKISCRSVWDISDALGVNRIEVSSACETLKIKINKCQIGAFR